MNETDLQTLDVLRTRARDAAGRAHVPYSRRHVAAALLLSDGAWVPGVRVESASFSLVIPAIVNAYSTSIAQGRTDAVAVALNRPFLPEETTYLQALAIPFQLAADDALVAPGFDLPAPGEALSPFLDAPPPETPVDGIALARHIAERAHVPESQFPVGCIARVAGGRLVPGINVEHPDWSRILCAERNALGTIVSYGLGTVEALFLSCPCDSGCTPCGACRQLLVEHAPSAALWMDRGEGPPAEASPDGLLPGAFSGNALAHPH